MDIKIRIPDIGIDKAEVIDILVQVNDIVREEQSLIVVEGEKASMEIPSSHNGRIKEIMVKITDIIQKDSVIMVIEGVENSQLNTKNIQGNINPIILDRKVHASPLIRRLARALEIDITKINGTGRKNRIIKEDLDNYMVNINNDVEKTILEKKCSTNIHQFDFHRFGEVEQVKLNKVKKISGNTLFKNWSTVPHVTQFDEVDITNLEAFRVKYNKNNILNIKEKKLTLLPFIIKAIAKGLTKFPFFNSSISHDHDVIFLKKYINIGVAVDTDHGLFVPVIKNVKDKTLSDLAHEIYQKSNYARNGKLKISDLQGGSFTISSLGSLGGTFFTPIINGFEAAILGISKTFYKPIWNGNKFLPKLILPLSLSYNHRIIDGAEGAKFISFINTLLSDIRLILV